MLRLKNAEISPQEVRVWLAIQDGWRTNIEVAATAKVSRRTAENHTKRFSKLGIADVEPTWPSQRFRAAAKKKNRAYVARLERAKEALGI